MRRWYEFLASLKLTVILVLLIGVILSAGTIVESLKGAEAGRAIYDAPWFYALEGLFALNILCALIERWPRNRWRIGFAITHLSMLVILLGALMTLLFKQEGRMPIWEGDSTNVVFRQKEEAKPIELPFKVRLDSFEIDNYPGTRRPAMFRSRVAVLDPAAKGEQPAVIQMNQPLHYGGWSFFQSSYQIQGGREMTILSVSHDPGQNVVFLGYGLLVAGMIVVFATRLIQYRKAMAPLVPAAVVVAVLSTLLLASAAHAAVVPDAASVEKIRAIPVQHDGRVMPFDTQARNGVWTVTRKASWPGLDPAAMAAGWAIDPRGWANEPIVRVRGEIARIASLPAATRYASFQDLVSNNALRQAIAQADARQEREEKLGPADKHLVELEERLLVLDEYFRGDALKVMPAGDATSAWGAVRPASAAELVAIGEQVRASAPAHYLSPEAVARELRYEAVRPSRLAWLFLVPAAIAAALTLERDRLGLSWLAGIGVIGGFLVVTWSIAQRWMIAGRIPASNMYESMLFLGWGVAFFGVVSLLLRNRMLIFNAAAMAALATALLDLLPLDPFIHPMAPVLSGTPWLAIHVPIIMISYATLAIVTFFGHLVVGVEIFAPARRDLARRWSQLLYWYTHVGAILLIAGILTGSIWAASSWGRYWGWDPKEVWSLVAFLAYMAILHARFDQQIAEFGVAVSSIAAFWTILMTYLGVNFVLASGMHSYGFGSSSLVSIMAGIALVELLFLGAGWAAVRRRQAAGGEAAA